MVTEPDLGLFGSTGSPLADRARPHGLDDVIGQDSLAGPDGVLRSLLASGELPSMVFWGPPGSGKTTLCSIAGGILLWFGTGPIKGFAVTLSLGIVTSMFTAIMGTRAVINLIYGGKKRVRKLAI